MRQQVTSFTYFKPVCEACGSDNVMRDAWAIWSVEKQDWVLGNVFDNGFCDQCEGETSFLQQPVEQVQS